MEIIYIVCSITDDDEAIVGAYRNEHEAMQLMQKLNSIAQISPDPIKTTELLEAAGYYFQVADEGIHFFSRTAILK